MLPIHHGGLVHFLLLLLSSGARWLVTVADVPSWRRRRRSRQWCHNGRLIILSFFFFFKHFSGRAWTHRCRPDFMTPHITRLIIDVEINREREELLVPLRRLTMDGCIPPRFIEKLIPPPSVNQLPELEMIRGEV